MIVGVDSTVSDFIYSAPTPAHEHQWVLRDNRYMSLNARKHRHRSRRKNNRAAQMKVFKDFKTDPIRKLMSDKINRVPGAL